MEGLLSPNSGPNHEEQAQMLAFMQQLGALEKADPQEYERVMAMIEQEVKQAKKGTDHGG